MKKIFFGMIIAIGCSAASANAGSIYDGIWLNSPTGELYTIVTKGAGAIGNQAIIISMDLTQTWWDGLIGTFTGPNVASWSTFLPTDIQSSGTVTFISTTSMTITMTACTAAIPTAICPPLPATLTATRVWP